MALLGFFIQRKRSFSNTISKTYHLKPWPGFELTPESCTSLRDLTQDALLTELLRPPPVFKLEKIYHHFLFRQNFPAKGWPDSGGALPTSSPRPWTTRSLFRLNFELHENWPLLPLKRTNNYWFKYWGLLVVSNACCITFAKVKNWKVENLKKSLLLCYCQRDNFDNWTFFLSLCTLCKLVVLQATTARNLLES